mgnify:CR=1 FL=1
MKRRFGVMAMAAVLSAALAVPVYAGTWKYVNDQWKYQRGANKFAYNEWIQDKGKYYYLDNDGYVTTGWQQKEETVWFNIYRIIQYLIWKRQESVPIRMIL